MEIDSLYPFAIGYFFAIFVAHYPILWVVTDAWERIGQNDLRRPYPWLPPILGMMERGLYVTAFYIDKPEFIGIWLVLKVAGQWVRWSQENVGRSIFTIFLIGNILNIAYAAVGSRLVVWCDQLSCDQCEQQRFLAAVVPSVAIALTFCLWCLLRYSITNVAGHLLLIDFGGHNRKQMKLETRCSRNDGLLLVLPFALVCIFIAVAVSMRDAWGYWCLMSADVMLIAGTSIRYHGFRSWRAPPTEADVEY